MTTDHLQAEGSLTFRSGAAGVEVLPSVIVDLADASYVAFTRGTIDIYDLGPTDLGDISGALDVAIGGNCALWVGGDLASLTDFSFYPAAEADPAMAIAVADNSGTVSGHIGNAWTRHFITLYAPTDNPAWKRAAFASVGLVFKSMPTVTLQHIDDVQWEIAPLNSNPPLGFSPARSIDIRVRPTRLNHSTNPSFEVDLTDWTTVGATLTRITTDHAQGAACCRITSFAPADTVDHIVRSLVPGRDYTVSVYLRSTDGGDAGIKITGARNVADGIVYSPLTWQTAPLGTEGSPDWRRVWVSFTAEATTMTLTVRSLGAATVLLDGVLIEEGNGLGAYFDGDSGSPDYAWETAGTPGKARSYYYRNKTERHYALGKTLRENVGQGLFIGDPEYATSAISSSTAYGSGPYGSGPYGG